jgi:predicted transposase/invertase (TIGR01784 family)
MKKQRQLVSFDWAIKKLLRSKSNFGILEGFLSELLAVDIKIIEILESEANPEYEKNKYNRVDLKVKDQNGEILIIEVQYNREYDYFHRLSYGSSKVIVEHMKEGQAYEGISKVISISILYFDLGAGEDYIYKGRTVFTGMHLNDELDLNQIQKTKFNYDSVSDIFPEYYLIKINQFNDVAKDSLDEWIYFLKNEEIKDDFHAKGLKEAKTTLDVMKMPPEQRSKYEAYHEDLHYQASMYQSSYGVGFIKGEETGKINLFRTLLTTRFSDIPNWVESKYLQNPTVEQLEHWSKNLFTAEKIEDVFGE